MKLSNSFLMLFSIGLFGLIAISTVIISQETDSQIVYLLFPALFLIADLIIWFQGRNLGFSVRKTILKMVLFSSPILLILVAGLASQLLMGPADPNVINCSSPGINC